MENEASSALERQREEADFTHDIGSSLESTDESIHSSDSEYDADEILAQRVYDEEDDSDPIVQYLVKYTGYPLHRSTWEPRANLRPSLFLSWKEKATLMGKDAREEEGRKNTRLFNQALEKALAAKEVRRRKRTEIRTKKQNVREREKKAREERPKKKGVARVKPLASRTHQTLNKATTTGTALPKRRRSVVTTSGGEYDDASSSDDESNSDDEPLIKKRARNPAKSAQQEQDADANVKRPTNPPSPLSRRRTLPTVFIDSPERRPAHRKQPKNPTRTSSTDGLERRAQQPSTAASRNGPPTDANAAAPDRRKSLPGVSSLDPAVPELYARRDPGPIKLVNEAKQPGRVWNTQNKHFNTLQFRQNAIKRGRMESTPDFDSLNFVNGTPAGPSRPRPMGNTSEVRIPAPRRVQEDPQEVQAGATTATASLQPYEVGKHQLTCYEWKFGTCVHTPETCRFLHREKDPAGKDLPLSRWDHTVPPKHKTPPETCWYWFCDHRCKKTADECHYAHRNTGHLPKDGHLISINPNVPPGSAEAHRICGQDKRPEKRPDTRQDQTCWFWMSDSKNCMKGDACKFAHVNTGLLANPVGGDPTPIDRSQAPVHRQPVLPKFANPPITCFHWLRSFRGCDNTAEACQWAHWNTGYLGQIGRGPVEISSQERPHMVLLNPPNSNGHTKLEKKTCFFWNQGTCKQPPETCRGLHRYTGFVANPPPSWVAPVGWKQRLRDAPVNRDEPERINPHHAAPIPHNVAPVPRHVAPAPMVVDEPSSVQENIDKIVDQMDRRVDRENVEMIQPAEMKEMLERENWLDYETMFSCNGGLAGDILAEPNAFVLYDPKLHHVQHELLTRWLLLNHVDVYNGHFGVLTGWDMFRKAILGGKSGIIIAHPDFDGYASLPNFADVLRGTVRVWSIGYQEPPDFNMWDPKTEHLEYFRQEIFPHGGIIYLTDDVFLQTPQLALRIFEHFFAMLESGRRVKTPYFRENTKVNDGLLLWRLGTRPELMQWIGDTVMAHQPELAAGDPNITALDTLYTLLHHNGYIDPDPSIFSAENPRPPPMPRLDYFPVISAREQLANDMGVYYNARRVSQHDANTDMVCHYSGLLVLERRLYRQLFVVHTDLEQGAEWKEKFHTVDEVMTGERCVEYFEAGEKGNRFENWAWMYEKRKDEWKDGAGKEAEDEAGDEGEHEGQGEGQGEGQDEPQDEPQGERMEVEGELAEGEEGEAEMDIDVDMEE